MQPQHHDQGWNATTATATIGATLAAGILVGLDADTLATAVGIGMSQTTGSRQADGSLLEPFMAGKGAANGINSALMARAGISSTKIALEHVRGFFALLSLGTARLDEVTDGLGEQWRWLGTRAELGADPEGRVDAVLPGAGATLIAAVGALPSAADLNAVLAAATPGGMA
jgi:2-methylcitrate dehydratase PrpD